MSDSAISNTPAASTALPTLHEVEQISWKDKIGTLLFWTVLILLLFRSLLWGDYRSVMTAPDAKSFAYFRNLLVADLFCTGIFIGTLYWLILSRIGYIALNTFREAVRNRILYFILFFALILMMASGVVKELAISAHSRIVTDIGLTSISFFGLMAAVFAGISLVYNELERKTIYTIVSKPVHRYQFLLGKYFGLLLTIYVIVGIMTLFFFMVFNYQANTSDEALEKVLYARNAAGEMRIVEHPGMVKLMFLVKAFAKSGLQAVANLFGVATGAVSTALLASIAMICLQLMIVTAIAVLFSSFSTPALSAIFTVMLFMAGQLNEDIMRFGMRIAENAQKEMVNGVLPFTVQFKILLTWLAALIVPNLDSLNVNGQVIHGEAVEVWRGAVLYAFCYTGTVLWGAVMIFSKRNFK